MKLSKEYKNVLKHFRLINQNMNFIKGNVQSTIIGSNSGTIFFCRYTSLEEIPEDFAVGDLGKILNVFDLFEDFDIDVIKNKKIIIKNDKKSIEIGLTKNSFIQYEKNPNKFKVPEGLKFNLSNEILNETIKLSSILSTDHFYFEGINGKLFFGTENCNNPTTNSSKYEVGVSQKNFKYVIDKEYLKLYQCDYEVIIPDKKGIYFCNINTEHKIEYFVAINSTYSR